MTEFKKTETAEQAKKPAAQTGAELSDAELNRASGGALNAYKPGAQTEHGAGGGGGAGRPAAADGSVKTNTALIGLL